MTMLLAALALALAAALAGVVLHQRRRMGALRDRVERATAELEFLQQSFARFAPAEVVDEITERGIRTAGRKTDLTILFTDLKGFTVLADRMDPGVLVEVLNGYFRRMARAVGHHRGHVAKFLGDGMLALFGALEPNPWQSQDAVSAALRMRAALAEYNRELEARGLSRLAHGIGIHRGTAITGIIGSDQLVEFTAVGKHVNLAFCLEELTREHNVDILVTEAVRERLDERFRLRELPPQRVRGRSDPVRTFAVEDFDDTAWQPDARAAEPEDAPARR